MADNRTCRRRFPVDRSREDVGVATLITKPTRIQAVGVPPKLISEFVGRVNTGTDGISIALMESPSGWSEPGQTPEFDEYTLVVEGELVVRTAVEQFAVRSGEAVWAPIGEWVQYSTPGPIGARYVAVCLPAFSPDTVHRDSTE
jgi:mannose-6-phosphate isomerase-like protein (cupin superfamily)